MRVVDVITRLMQVFCRFASSQARISLLNNNKLYCTLQQVHTVRASSISIFVY